MGLSFGQSCAKALADYFVSALSADIEVLDRWPTNSEQLRVNSNGRVKTISITKIGRRRRIDGMWTPDPLAVNVLSPTQGRWVFPVGGLIQPIQLDIWTAYDGDREDVIEQLDDALTAGVDKTLRNSPIVDDPVRDGIVVALDPRNGWVGYADCWFDDCDLDDVPATIKVAEFRATYLGDMRGTFARIREAPILNQATLKYQSAELGLPPPAATPVDTVTVTTGEEQLGQGTFP